MEYPIEDVVRQTKSYYLNNTVAYAVAFALWSKVKEINLFGIDFSYAGNLYLRKQAVRALSFGQNALRRHTSRR